MRNIEEVFSQRERDSLSSEAPAPLYHQMYTLLKNRILDGSIANGEQMPTEQELAAGFNVSRITTKRAMDELAADNLIERHRGKGSHVIYHYEPEQLQAPLVGMLEKLASMSRSTKIKVLDAEKIVPPADIGRQLQVAEGEGVLHVKRVRRDDDDTPFAYYESWTLGVTKGFTKKSLESKARFEILADSGVTIAHIEQYLSADKASAQVAKELKMSVDDPVLTLMRHSYDEDENLVDIIYCQYHPKRFHYRMNLRMDD